MSEDGYSQYSKPEPDYAPIPIVAIGGSAGDQQAITELLSHLPADTGFAFVYIPHPATEQPGKLNEILSEATPMTVVEATPLLRIKPNYIYMIPPGDRMEIVDDIFVLNPAQPQPGLEMPVDQFFISLAERQKDGAIGVVLSGTGGDGNLGLKAVKAAGGVTFAQDDATGYPGMHQAAMEEQVVDMLLSPQDIAAELIRLSRHTDVLQLTAEASESTPEAFSDLDLEKILAFVKSIVGVDFQRYKKTTIRRRVVRRMLLYKLDTPADYMQYLKQHPVEATILYNDLLIHVTSFFRDEKTMDYLKNRVFPAMLAKKTAKEAIRIWVAGCSTGQEAYSLAIILTELLGDRITGMPVHIFATDLSDTAIAKARLGVYTQSEVKDVSPERLERFFTMQDEQYRISKSIRDLCIFAPHDLLGDPPFSRLDLISCRNLMIYMEDSLQKKALATFHYALNPDGVLVLGKSEAVGSAPDHFSQIEKEFKVFIRKNNTLPRIRIGVASPKSTPSYGRRIPVSTVREPSQSSEIDQLVDSWLLTNLVPASVVVDQHLEILQFRGATSVFLEHASGKASLNLSKMARPALVFELRNAVHKVRKTGQTVSKSGLEITINDKIHYVGFQAAPLVTSAKQQLILILFEELQEKSELLAAVAGDAEKRNELLEAELAALRQDTHSIIEEQEASNEELQSASEEIISSNEELQSINEELETSKEEIESANEELRAVNQQLQLRNDQLSESYAYSEAILSTISEATLVLDPQLRIRHANRAFYRIFHSVQANIEGSSLFEPAGGLPDFSALREILHEVTTREGSVSDVEIKIRLSPVEERTMLIHCSKTSAYQKETILLVFEDITEHRRAEAIIRERHQWFEELIDNATALIWVSDPEGKVNFLNKAWLDFTGASFSRNDEHRMTESIHAEDRKAYQQIRSENIGARKPYDIEYRLRQRDGEYHWVLENAKPMFSPDGIFTGYIGTCTDVHLQKTLTQVLNNRVEERTREVQQSNSSLVSSNHELTETAARLQSVLNGVPAAVTLMEAVVEGGQVVDFTTTAFNEKALELTAQTREDIIARTLLEAHPVLKETGLFDLYVHVYQTGEPIYKEVSGIRPVPGEVLAFLITRQIDRKGVVVTVLDISEQKQAEVKLVQTVDTLQAVLNSSPASIGFFQPIYDENAVPVDFRLVVCNRKFSDGFGKQIEEVIGQPATSLYEGRRLRWMRTMLREKTVIYKEVFNEEEQEWHGVTISRHDQGVAVTELNISKLKEAQQEQEQMVQQLQGTYKMIESLSVLKEYVRHRGSFLRSTFHDLRGSFGIISGAATLLQIVDTEEDRAKTLDMIQRNLIQVAQMMNQLLDFSRLESGEEVVEISVFNASALLHELCQGSCKMAADKNLRFDFDGPSDLHVEGDAVKVRRIAQNLILNALKYTDEGGISVQWQAEPSQTEAGRTYWHFLIHDTGPGIPERVIYKLLHAEQEDPAPEAQAKGADLGDVSLRLAKGEGIGLFIVKRLVELLEGELAVESGAGAGTTFRITLPAVYPR